MATWYTYTVRVEAETKEQADEVINERLDPEEDYGFPYVISCTSDTPVVEVSVLADLMDRNTDGEGQWSGADICDDLSELIKKSNGWNYCPDHGNYSATKKVCPLHQFYGEDNRS